MDFYDSIVERAANDASSPIKYMKAPSPQTCLKMTNHDNPYSITLSEFEFMRDFIQRHKLRRGFECATAFGISALAAGLGFKETYGTLVTIDAYIEEKYNKAKAYRGKREVNDDDPDGLKSVKWLSSAYDLQDVIMPSIGWSPDDVPAAIVEHYGTVNKLDFVFLDAGHWDEAGVNDIAAIRPFISLDKPFAMFMHDASNFKEPFWTTFNFLFRGMTAHKIPQLAGKTFQMRLVTNLAID